MYLFSAPHGWKEVEESDFEEFLKACADYRTESYSNYRRYYFAHNKKDFAMILNGKVLVDPELLNAK